MCVGVHWCVFDVCAELCWFLADVECVFVSWCVRVRWLLVSAGVWFLFGVILAAVDSLLVCIDFYLVLTVYIWVPLMCIDAGFPIWCGFISWRVIVIWCLLVFYWFIFGVNWSLLMSVDCYWFIDCRCWFWCCIWCSDVWVGLMFMLVSLIDWWC